MRALSLAPSFSLLVACFVAVACGDSGSDDTGPGGSSSVSNGSSVSGTGSSSSSGSGSGSSSSTGYPSCDEPTPIPGAPIDVDVSSVQASARDDANAAIQNEPFQLCGTDLCLFADSNTIGNVLFMNSQSTLDRPLFKPGDSLTYGKFGYLYTAASPSPLPGIFPRMTDSGMQLAPGGTVSVAGATLTLAADSGLTIDDLTYDTPDKQTFRAAQVPEDLVDDVTGSAEFAMAYALGPIDTLLCPEATLVLDNYAGLPANAAVELWVQEVGIEEYFGGYGEWVKIDDGMVSADGTTVSTSLGMPVILNVAIKPVTN